MKITNNRESILYFVLILTTILFLLCFIIFITVPAEQCIANAETLSASTYEEESAILTESDDIDGYEGWTIRDYAEMRTIPNITYKDTDLVLNTTTDDVIVKIVPKGYFMSSGDNLYIGKEYGFFIHTEQCANIAGANNMYSTVVVFDIINSLNMVESKDIATTEVEVLYQYEFIYLSPQESHYTVLSVGGDFLLTPIHYTAESAGIVIPLARGTADIRKYDVVDTYYLKDVSFAATLQNAQNLNQYDEGYEAYRDDGAFFIGGAYCYSGQEWVDKVPSGSDAAEWFYTAATIAGGILTFVPGANGIGALTLAASIGFFIGDIVQSHVSVLQDASSRSICVENEYNTRLSQVQYDGQLTKTMGVSVNTAAELSYLYGNGDFVRMEYDISSTPNDKIPHTWFCREIGLKIVDNNGNLVCAPEIGVHGFDLYEEEYAELDMNGGIAYLLPNGNNTFTFKPQYSGEYIFDFGINSHITLKAADIMIAEESDGFHINLEGGEICDLRVLNNTDERLILEFAVEPTLDRMATLAEGEKYIVKLEVDIAQCVTVSSGNENVEVGIYVKNDAGTLVRYEPNGLSWSAAPSISFTFIPGDYYILLDNKGSETTASVSIEAVHAVTAGSNNVSFGENWVHFSFVPAKGGGYVFTLSADAPASVQMILYDANMQPINMISHSVLYRADGFMANSQYYIAIRSLDNGALSGILTIEEWNNAFAWYVEGEKITGQAIELFKGWEYDIYFTVNDDVVIRSFSQTFFSTVVGLVLPHESNIYTIVPNDIPLDAVVQLSANASEGLVYDFYLEITFKPNDMVVAQKTESYADTTDFFFVVNDSHVKSVNYTIEFRNLLLVKTVINESFNVSGKGEYLVTHSIPAQALYSATFSITSITYNNREVPYSGEQSSRNFMLMFGKGDGTPENPIRLYSSYHYLNFVLLVSMQMDAASSLSWRLETDIDISSLSVGMIPCFYGVFDGAGHTLSGLTIEIPTIAYDEEQNFGWVGINKGTIKNVVLDRAIITAPVYHSGAWVNVGVVAGINAADGVITNVRVTNAEINTNRNMSSVGGLVGVNEGRIEFLCTIVGSSIFSNGDTGAICGENTGIINDVIVLSVQLSYYATVQARSIGSAVGYCPSGDISGCGVSIVTITVTGADAGIVPNIGIFVGHFTTAASVSPSYSAVTVNLDNLPESQRGNSYTDRYYGNYT